MALLTSLSSGAQTANSKSPRNILVVIGYTDDPDAQLPPIYFNHLATFIEQSLIDTLNYRNFKLQGDFWFSAKARIRIVNVNAICPGETAETESATRWMICPEQQKQFELTRTILEQKLTKEFDEIIYIGHARQGNGLGLGPFNDQYTLRIENLFVHGSGRLKRFVMATCNATDNFGYLSNSFGIEFIGGTKFRVTWEENLRFVQRYLSELTF